MLQNVQAHYPEQPEGLSDAVFALGSEGTRGNSYILPETPQAAIDPYMKDSGIANIASLGHRRWILNPSMAYIGFGQAGTSNVTYVVDKSGDSVDDTAKDTSGNYFNVNTVTYLYRNAGSPDV